MKGMEGNISNPIQPPLIYGVLDKRLAGLKKGPSIFMKNVN